jgi:hypothetical protein
LVTVPSNFILGLMLVIGVRSVTANLPEQRYMRTPRFNGALEISNVELPVASCII